MLGGQLTLFPHSSTFASRFIALARLAFLLAALAGFAQFKLIGTEESRSERVCLRFIFAFLSAAAHSFPFLPLAISSSLSLSFPTLLLHAHRGTPSNIIATDNFLRWLRAGYYSARRSISSNVSGSGCIQRERVAVAMSTTNVQIVIPATYRTNSNCH